jgi:hypothetical protein
MDFLRDQIWQFWGVVIGIFGVIVSAVLVYIQRSKKRLTYSVITETPLLSVDEEIQGKIKIKYGRKSIQNIFLVVLKIENKGNVDIVSSDYEEPIVFSFSDAEMLSAEIIEVSPKNLKPNINNQAAILTVTPILLNKKDYFVIKLLFSKYNKKVDVNTRIVGVKEIERIYDESPDLQSTITSSVVGLIVIASAVAILQLTSQFLGINLSSSSIKAFLIACISFGLIRLIYDIIKYMRKHIKQTIG